MFILKADYDAMREENKSLAAAVKVQQRTVDQMAVSLDRLTEELRRSMDAVARENAANEQLAALRSSFEWLTTHVNRLEEERAQLLHRLLGVSFPVPQILRQTEAEPLVPSQSKVVGRPKEDNYDETIPAMQAAGAMFQDIGDEEARRQGIEHDDLGNVRWTR